MGDGIAAGVAHLIFARVLLHVFELVAQASLDVVAFHLVVHDHFQALHVARQIVACVLHIGAYAQVVVGLGVGEPVLSLDVEGLLLLGVEGRCQQFQRGALVEFAGDGERAEIGAEDILLLTVKVDLERLHVLQRSEGGLAVGGLEVVVVFRDVADEVNGPSLVGMITQIGLIVEEVGLVFALGLQGSQQIAVGLVADGVAHRELLVAVAGIGGSAEEREPDGGFLLRGFAVGDVEHRRHLVAVFGLESAGREADGRDHVGVDDAQSLLLSTAHEEGSVNLHLVDIHRVLVKGSAPDIVLRRQFVMG